MKREDLKNLGLDKDNIDSIMKLHGEDVQGYQKIQNDLDTVKKSNDSLNEQLKQRDNDIKGLKKNSKDNEDLQGQLKELQDQYKKAGEDHKNEIHSLKVNNALNSTLSSYKARNNKAVKSLLDMDKIDLDDKGNLSGAKEQLDNISKDNSFLFDQGKNTDYKPGNSNTGDQSYTNQFIKAFGGKTGENK